MDIEDSGNDITTRDVIPSRVVQYGGVQTKRRIESELDETSIVPGIQKVWLRTFGCSHNVSDSEYMAGLLAKYGYDINAEQDEADIWVVNSCTVKDPSQAAFMNIVKAAKEIGKPVVVAGCVPQADRNLAGLEYASILGITQIDRIVEIVEQTLQGNVVRLLAKKELPVLDLPKVRKNPLVEIIPLSTGCLGACTYCKTKQARGKLGSYALEAIVERAREVIAEGVSEIWLSSEDTGAYGRDIGTDIAQLLRALIDVLPENGVMLRVGMTNPPYILEHLPAVAEILAHPKVYSFLHVPVQAGSDAVLTAMNREYTVADFCEVADKLLEKNPDMTLATDIICGFPGETEVDFEGTMELLMRYRLAITNISQFYPRPGTPAAKMKRIATQIVKDRSRRVTKFFETLEPYVSLPGQVVKVWFDIETSDDHTQSVGHTKSYVKVLVPFDAQLPGRCYMVKITSAHRFHVEGELVSLVNRANWETQGVNAPVRPAQRDRKGRRLPKVEPPSLGSCGDCGCESSCNVELSTTPEERAAQRQVTFTSLAIMAAFAIIGHFANN